jgi:hypothetical protein
MVAGISSIRSAQTEISNEDSKDIFYERSQEAFDQLRNYHLKTLLHYNAKLEWEDNFKQTTGNGSLNEDSNNNGVRAENFATTRTYIFETTMFLHQNVHK